MDTRAEKFWSLLKLSGTCLEWTRNPINKGYGQYWYNNKRYYVHRLAWILSFGEIPDNYQVHHKCHNKICCNIDHLELLEISEHAKIDNANAKKTHCKNGHEFTLENTYIFRQNRSCKTYRKDSQKKYIKKWLHEQN